MTAPTIKRKGASTAASVQDTALPIHTIDRIGTMMAVVTGASVWAKKTSTRSISFVTRFMMSPESRRSVPAGAWGSSWS